MCKDGQQVAAANQPMGNFKFTGLGTGSARTDSISLGQSQDGGVNWVASGGSADAITATYAPALTALVDGQLCYFRATASNATTTPTFAPNGLTAHTITKVGGTALVPGDIPGNLAECALRYNLANTRWELVNPAVPTASIGAGQFASSASGMNEPLNLQLVASVGSNLLTIAVKTTAGNDPSSSDPVIIPFRDSTVANGDNVVIKVTSALSINTNATGATLGSANSTAFRFWVVAFNNSGTPVLALINCLTPTAGALQVWPLNDRNVQSSTAMSGSATAAGVFYTPNGTTVTSKAICVLGFVEYNSTGLATAGTYNLAPQFTVLAGPHTPRPGAAIQIVSNSTTTAATTTSASYAALSSSQSVSITPTSAANVINVASSGTASASAAGLFGLQIVRGSTVIGNPYTYNSQGSTQINFQMSASEMPNSSGSLTYSYQGKIPGGNTLGYPNAGGAAGVFMNITEIMA